MREWRERGERREIPEVAIEHFEVVTTGDGEDHGRPYMGIDAHYTYAEGAARVDPEGVEDDFPVGLTQRIHTVLVREEGAWRAALVFAAEERR